MSPLNFEERAKLAKNPAAKKLLSLMAKKQSNLCFSADLTNPDDLLRLADQLGPEICLLKTHIDIVKGFSHHLTDAIKQLAHKHDFMIFEDRKFADNGNTSLHQYRDGVYHISDWADIINAHSLPGEGTIEGLKEVGLPKHRGLLLLAQMSMSNTLFTEEYTRQTVAMAEKHNDFVMGFISLEKLSDDPGMIHMTPGVQLTAAPGERGQNYLTPDHIIREKGSDLIIVGRGIYQANDPCEKASEYRKAAWEAYLAR